MLYMQTAVKTVVSLTQSRQSCTALHLAVQVLLRYVQT